MIEMSQINKYNCPVCSNKTGEVLQEFESKNAVLRLLSFGDNYDKEFLTNHIEKLWRAKSCLFVKCDSCSLSYAYPFVAGDALYYEKLYYNSFEYPQWKWEFEKAIEKIRLKTNSGLADSLLELGAGDGNFIKRVVDDCIINTNILTTEYSASGAEKIRQLGITCNSVPVWELCLPENKNRFDFICMFQILEHLDSLDKVFNSLNYLLKPKGNIFIAVPSKINREHFETLGFIEDVPPTHISRWSEESFKAVALKYNWTLVNYALQPNSFMKNIAKYLQFKYKDNGIIRFGNSISNYRVRQFYKAFMLVPFIIFNLNKLKSFNSKNMGNVQFVELLNNN